MDRNYVLKKIDHAVGELFILKKLGSSSSLGYNDILLNGEITGAIRCLENLRIVLNTNSNIDNVDDEVVYMTFRPLVMFFQNNSYRFTYMYYGRGSSLSRLKLFICWYEKFMHKLERELLDKSQYCKGVDMYLSSMQMDYKFKEN